MKIKRYKQGGLLRHETTHSGKELLIPLSEAMKALAELEEEERKRKEKQQKTHGTIALIWMILLLAAVIIGEVRKVCGN